MVEEFARALETAVRLLARRDHSEAELGRKLSVRGIGAATIAAVLARLREGGYLDDRRYAGRLAETLASTGKGYGPRLRHELQRRGIAAGIVVEVLELIGSTYAEEDALMSVMRTRFPDFDPTTAGDREKRRVVNYLQRRGYSLGAILAQFRDWRQNFSGD